jgi:hypothetical protein
MKLSTMTDRARGGLIALALTLVSSVLGQGITTSAISGIVRNKSGAPIAGATVTVLHEPTGTRATTTTRQTGQYDFSGLRVGGPYTVSVGGSEPSSRSGVYLDLGQTADVNFPPGASDIVQMQAFTVSGERSTTFDAARMSAGSSFTDQEIANIATVRNDVQDIARLDSRLTLNALDQGGQLSAQGQNFRYNSFLIDGVESNDPFGINSNGVSSLRSPLPLEAVQAISIELNPYDVRRSGFTGALINAVTKSGTNTFSGSAQYEFTNEDWRADNPRTGVKETFKERRYTFTFNGPIIRDRLFFALSFDDFQREATAPAPGFVFTAASLALIDQAIARAKALGYDPGTFAGASNKSSQKTYMAKIDWNITDQHRMTLTYRENQGITPIFSGVTSNTGSSLSNMWFDQPRDTKNYTAQIFSQWTPDLRTEASVSYSEYDATAKNRGAPFPAIGIADLAGTNMSTGLPATGFLNFGTEFSRQLNILNTNQTLMKLIGEYSLGNHTIAIGAEADKNDIDDRFLQAYYGSYTFRNSAAFGSTPARTSIENWLLGLPTNYTNAQPLPGATIQQSFAQWTYIGYAALIQDTWRPNSRLTIVGGLRYDLPSVDQKPVLSPTFLTAFGLRNDETIDGNATLAPRVGFNYRLPAERKTEVRGGVGLFQGRNPAVWLANSYQNAGSAASITVNVNGNNQQALQFQPDVTKQPIPPGAPPAPTINLMAPGFKMPSSWKGNLAVDHQLPFLNMVLTAEVTATQVNRGLFIDFLNFQTPATGPSTMPDGRNRYAGSITPNYSTNASPNNVTTFPQTNTAGRRRVNTGGPTGGGFAEVYRINNTNKGESHDFTLAIGRPLKNRWSAGVAWTRSYATEVSPMTSSTAGSLYNLRAVYNPNENVASTSNTETKNKIVAQVTRQFDFFKIDNTKTTVSLVYEARSGHAYSWVFKGDANGDGITDNDLFYMPTGPDDPKVRWVNPSERDAFFAFAGANGLNRFAGRVIPRNADNSPWVNVLDFTVTQQLPVWRRIRAEMYFQMVNLGNLLNDEWGLLEEIPFSYKRTVAGAIYDPAANGGQGQWGYLFNGNTVDGLPIVADDTQSSRWQAKLGIRIKF